MVFASGCHYRCTRNYYATNSEANFLCSRLDVQSITQSIINSINSFPYNELFVRCSSTFVESNYPCCSRNVCNFETMDFLVFFCMSNLRTLDLSACLISKCWISGTSSACPISQGWISQLFQSQSCWNSLGFSRLQ